MNFSKGVLTFAALLLIFAASGTALAAGVDGLTGPVEWRGAARGSLFTAALMLVMDPSGTLKGQANKGA